MILFDEVRWAQSDKFDWQYLETMFNVYICATFEIVYETPPPPIYVDWIT